ncbi:hypothetical protein FF125_16120 [Aureibaculum algae]|uniref:Uncharacterized protein n=1 Tax=Aureibaculum algae TaxID=2584122 RepID=A0A5B7TUI5_9FLAO|nr:hypothetical protein FF125_16120 [Aureibaculum algae]
MSLISANGYVYGKLRVCVRGFSEGKSEASKQATNFGLAKTSNFLYTVLATGFSFQLIPYLRSVNSNCS